jgi:hypothetical protein
MESNNEKLLKTFTQIQTNQSSLGSTIGFVITTFLFTIVLVVLFTAGNISEVGQNWPRYRCNPFYMPFAASFGSDPVENFNFCINNIFDSNAKTIFQPLYGILGSFGSIMSDIVNATMGIRILFANMLNGFQSIIMNMRGQMNMLMNQVRMSFLKMNNLMGRVFGTMYGVIWMGMSAMSAGQNIANNDLVQFLFEFCFDPDTMVPLANGMHVPISMVSIGDYVLNDEDIPVKVTSKFEFDGSKTPMVAIGSQTNPIVLSSKHFVNGKHASEHSTARVVSSIPKLICLNVTGHLFKVGMTGDYHIVSDYDESSNEDVVSKTQAYAESVLNGTVGSTTMNADLKRIMDEYSLGVDCNAFVKMKNGEFKQIRSVQIGEELYGCGKVLGKVYEKSEYVVQFEGLPTMTPSQLIWNNTKYIRYGSAFSDCIVKKPTVFAQFFTEKCGAFIIKSNESSGVEVAIREYREVPDPSMEDLYESNIRLE